MHAAPGDHRAYVHKRSNIAKMARSPNEYPTPMYLRRWIPALILLACNKGDTGDDTASTFDSSTGSDDWSEYCEMYQSDELGPSVKFTLRNVTDGPVWVPAYNCAGIPAIAIIDPADVNATNRFDTASTCFPSLCEDVIAHPNCDYKCSDCESAIATRIEAGGSITFDWAGGHGTEMTADYGCVAGPQCGGATCYRPTKAPPANYNVSLDAYAECSINCECTGTTSPDGWCTVLGDSATYTGGSLRPATKLNYPSVTSLELLITNP